MSSNSEDSLTDLLRTFITASHILHYHGVLDAYGHISVRNPLNRATFFMSHSCAPALVSSRADIVEYRVADAAPIDPAAPPGFSERCIHSEIFKRFPAVNSVVHSHCAEVVPFSVARAPLLPTIHMAGFLRGGVPVWDIQHAYQPSDARHDLLVKTPALGASLASAFVLDEDTFVPQDMPDHPVVLMRGHGFTTAATDVKDAVYQAIYTRIAAQVQTTAMLLQNAAAFAEEGLSTLSDKEAKDCKDSMGRTIERPWALWCREVEVSPLYRNELKE